METKIDILLVDDHSLILSGISRILENMPEIGKVQAVTSGKEASSLITSRNFDLYILDIELPDTSGFDLIKQVRTKNEDARIIINTMHEQIWIVNKLIHCQVDAIILKSSESSVVEQAVRAVIGGNSYCCSRFEHISQKLKNGKKKELLSDIPTKRELEVLKAISQGNSTIQIARMLNISENTVETYRKQLMLKFDAKNATDLALKALAKGWITLDM